MADRMHPTPIEDLMRWVFDELETRRSVFGLPEELFFRPWAGDPFVTSLYGRVLQTPLGVAAGPHTQLAQNIVTAYLAGARFIELKTVQTLDELSVSKPCIDMEDVGYNCEWSQELALHQSFEEYLKAWILLHALGSRLGLDGGIDGHGFLFNMSVGYNLEGIHADNVQRFLDLMRDAAGRKRELVLTAARDFPGAADLDVDDRLSESVTLSTMHGCPPDEIERIGLYLISELGLHTAVKLNPTLLGPELVREILHGELGFDDIEVPDQAFEHDPGLEDAVAIVRSLHRAAEEKGVFFWVKLTNTLETRNLRKVLPADEKMHYMSGRALHPVAVQLAADLSDRFAGRLPISLAGGADAFNLSDLAASGLVPVTVCSDLLKPGGYGRLPQYLDRLADDMRAAGAASIFGFVCRRALSEPGSRSRLFDLLPGRVRRSLRAVLESLGEASCEPLFDRVTAAGRRAGLDHGQASALADLFGRTCARLNLRDYARRTRSSGRYRKPRRRAPYKTKRPLGPFDCIAASCREGCPTGQNIPDYMYLVARGRYDEAVEVILRENPLPSITGTVCDHPCMDRCVRSLYDRSLAVREIKRFVVERAGRRRPPERAPGNGVSVAVVGAGPAGLAAAYFLALLGFDVTVFDAGPRPGGIPARIIPSFRLPDSSLAADVDRVRELGVKFRHSTRLGRDVELAGLREEHRYVFVGVGAHQGARLRIEGDDARGVFDCLDFLARVRAGRPVELGRRVLVVGGGNSAMDAARTAWRLAGRRGEVTLVYRRTAAQMPAGDEELEALLAEGVAVRELFSPERVVVEDGRVVGLECVRMELGPPDDSGRPRPVPVDGSTTVLPADAVIVAVGQKPESALLQKSGLSMTGWGTVRVDDATGETSMPGVFAGGDVVHGGASVVQAIGDARRAVREILRREGLPEQMEPLLGKDGGPREYLVRKSRRIYPEPIPELPVERRRGFEQVGLGLDEEQARREAGRCLDCDEFCSLCVTVCPNRANHWYLCEPFVADLPTFRIAAGKVERDGVETFAVEQASQVVNLADWCNECGNCQTFCPTRGAPYRDKPRLCFGDESFADEERAYRLRRTADGWNMEYKEPGGMHTLTLAGDRLAYASPGILAQLDASDLSVRRLQAGPEARHGARADLHTCATMFVLARSLAADSTFLPLMGDIT